MASSNQVKVAYLGPPASFTHEAAKNSFPTPNTELVAIPTISSVFNEIQHKKAQYGVVPIENSSNGSVVFSLDLFVDKSRKSLDVVVIGDAFVSVRHCLLGRKPKNGTDTDVSHVTTLRTHPQAWTQCTRYLDAHLSSAKRFDASSTSEAAAIVAKDDTGTSASISNKLAAEAYGLDVLAEGIEDSAENTTRFLLITHRDNLDSVGEAKREGIFKTLLSFSVGHEDPGALAKAIGVFGTHGINLTSINARPSGERNWHYVFLVEFTGGYWAPQTPGKGESKEGGSPDVASHFQQNEAMLRQSQDVDAGGAVAGALKELETVVKEWKWLGCWKSSE